MKKIFLIIAGILFLTVPLSVPVFAISYNSIPVIVNGKANIASYHVARLMGGINTAVATLGSTTATLVVDDPETLTASLTVPSNISLIIIQGGSITKAGTATLTINGPFSAGNYQVFSGFNPGDITFGWQSHYAIINPLWFGATGNGTTDDSQAMNEAATSCSHYLQTYYGCTVFTPTGLYYLAHPILGHNGVSWHGITGDGSAVHGTQFLLKSGIPAFDLSAGGGNANYRDFLIDGNSIIANEVGFLVGGTTAPVSGAGQLYIKDVTLSTLDKAIDMQNTQQVWVSDSQMLYDNYGVYHQSFNGGYSGDVHIKDCYISNNNEYGLYLVGDMFNVSIDDSVIQINPSGDLYTTATALNLTGNHFEDGGYIYNSVTLLSGAGSGIISGNIWNTAHYANDIYVYGANTGNIEIMANKFRGTLFVNATSETSNIDIFPTKGDTSASFSLLGSQERLYNQWGILPSSISVGAPPNFGWTNTNPYAVQACIRGGTVSEIDLGPNSAHITNTGAISGCFFLPPLSYILITDSAAPTMEVWPQ